MKENASLPANLPTSAYGAIWERLKLSLGGVAMMPMSFAAQLELEDGIHCSPM